MAGKCKCS